MICNVVNDWTWWLVRFRSHFKQVHHLTPSYVPGISWIRHGCCSWLISAGVALEMIDLNVPVNDGTYRLTIRWSPKGEFSKYNKNSTLWLTEAHAMLRDLLPDDECTFFRWESVDLQVFCRCPNFHQEKREFLSPNITFLPSSSKVIFGARVCFAAKFPGQWHSKTAQSIISKKNTRSTSRTFPTLPQAAARSLQPDTFSSKRHVPLIRQDFCRVYANCYRKRHRLSTYFCSIEPLRNKRSTIFFQPVRRKPRITTYSGSILSSIDRQAIIPLCFWPALLLPIWRRHKSATILKCKICVTNL